MEYKKACKIGFGGFAVTLSGDNVISTSGKESHIYTSEEYFELKNYNPSSTDLWMPLGKFPDHIPMSQNTMYIKSKYKKFIKEKKHDKSSS